MKKFYFFILLFLSINYAKAQSLADYLNFDGVDDTVSLTNTYNSISDFTIEAWIKTDSDGIIIYNISDYDSSYLAVTNGKLTYTTGRHGYGGFILTSNQNIDDNTWHHVAFSTSSINTNGQGSLYIDGVLDNSGSFGVYTVPMGSLTIGGVNTSHFSGSIDELRVWDVVRTAAEIDAAKSSEIQCNESGLIAYYQFNKGIDASENTNITSLTDITGNGNNGTLTNFALTGSTSNWLAGSQITSLSSPPNVSPIAYTQDDTATALTATPGTNGISLLWYTDATGGTGSVNAPTPSTTTLGNTSYYVSSVNSNGCESERAEIVVTVALPATHLNFDGVNNFVQLTNESNFDFTTTFSMETWIRVASFTQEWQTVISKGAEGPRIHRLGSSNFIAFGTGGADDLASTVSVNDGNWHHIAATCNNGFKSLYVDGILQGTQTISTPLTTNNDNIRIGSQIDIYDPIRAFHGDIDDVRIWNIARTAEQINGSKNCELQGTETGLIAYYNFNQGANSATNTSETTAIDATGANNGTLTNFDLTGTTSNWLAGSPVTTGSITPSEATVTTPVTYNQGDTASPLTATTGANGTSLLWYTAESGSTGSTTAPTPDTSTVGSTSYWVSSTNDNGCESNRTEIVVTVESSLNTNHFEISNKLKMYPNPATNAITIDGTDLANAKLQVLDITGKVLNNKTLKNNTNNIDITKYPSGIYLFKIITNEGTITNKVIKQ